MPRLAQAWALALLAGLWPWAACQASAMRYCDQPAPLTAQQQDRLLRLAAVIKTTLDDSGQRLALIARSGLDLDRFGVRTRRGRCDSCITPATKTSRASSTRASRASCSA
jgi:hypothetical protein